MSGRILTAFLLLLSLAPAPGAAQGRRTADPCRQEGRETACFIAHEQDYLGIYGLATAESHRAAGVAIRRAMFIDGYGRHLVAVEFRRAPGREPLVAVYPPREERAASLAEPALVAAVPLDDWQEVESRGRYFDRALAPRVEPREPGMITICTHAWVYFVEYTDPVAEQPSRQLRRRVENACDGALTGEYATLLSDLAVRLLPACAALDRDLHRNSAALLNICARFDGDRLAAASVFNRIGALRGGGHPSQLPLLQGLFDSRATLDWNGERIERQLAEAWLSRTSEPPASFFVRRIHGESARRVRLEGALERWTDNGENLWVAPVEMIWAFTPAQVYLIEQATVGAFVQTETSCNPNRLTGGGNC